MQKIRKDLFPDVIYEGKTYTNGDVSPLVQIVKQEGYKGKIVVSGEGSIGKSTMLTDLRLSMLREERAFVYFNLRDLMDARDVEALADRVNGYKGGDLIVILDSYDETSMTVDDPENSARAKAERLIDGFAARNSVALLVVGARQGCKSTKAKAERDDFGFVGRSYEDNLEFDAWARDRGFKTAMLQRFSDEKLDSILSDRKNISPELRKLLKNTMFLSMYLEAPEKDWESAASEAKFIDKYFDEVFCAKLEKGKPEDRRTIKASLFCKINAIGENIWNGYCRKPRNRVDFDNRTELNTIFTQEQDGNDWEVHATQEKYLSYCVAKYLSQKAGDGILNIFNDRFGSDFLPEDLERIINEGLYYTGQLLSDPRADHLNDALHKTSNSNIFCWLSQIILGHNKGEIRYGETVIEELPTKAFKRNIYLKSIELPVNIKNIEAGSFIGCTSLEQINISKKNHKYKCIDGNLYSKDGKKIIQYAIGKAENYFEIPSRVETIGRLAFYESQSLKRITIPGSVKVINFSAFNNCQSLESVEISEGVEAIIKTAFTNCRALKMIFIPSSVNHIDERAFNRCASLCQISVDENNHNYKSIDGNLFSKDETLLIIYAIGKQEDSFKIPTHVENICEYAFYGCQSIKKITIPSSVRHIAPTAFHECKSLYQINVDESNKNYKSIDGNLYSKDEKKLVLYAIGKQEDSFKIPTHVENICEYAFYGCQSIKKITISCSVRYIDVLAFDNCESLCQIYVDPRSDYYKSIEGNLYTKDGRKLIRYAIGKRENTFAIPSCGELIGENAFSNCKSLKYIVIPGSVKSINYMAFEASSLEDVEILEGVEGIEAAAFVFCQSLKSITIPGSVKVIDRTAFAACISLENVEISEGVKTIKFGAFGLCRSLKRITMPHSIKDIDKGAFRDSESISTVYYGGTEKEWKRKGFDKSKELAAAEKYYYSEQEPESEGNYWHYGEDGKTPVIW